MEFRDLINNQEAKRMKPDIDLVQSLIKTSKQDLKFLESCKIDIYSARKVISNYYDVLRSILEAIACLDGFKIYSHEAFTFFLKQKQEFNFAEKFDRFRRIRNNINYYGRNIEIQEAIQLKQEIKDLIKILSSKYLNNY
ncbi:MAG: hypothetical protein V1824_02730 [archaeon]